MSARISRFFPFAILAGFALLAALNLGEKTQGEHITQQQDPAIGMEMPVFSLPTMEEKRSFTRNDIAERTYLLNFFATWCIACKAEYPLLQEFATKHKLPVYGIAWKDNKDALKYWLIEAGDIYKQVGLDDKGKLAISLGLKGVPETYLIHDGKVVAVYRGALSKDAIKNFISPALKQIEGK